MDLSAAPSPFIFLIQQNSKNKYNSAEKCRIQIESGKTEGKSEKHRPRSVLHDYKDSSELPLLLPFALVAGFQSNVTQLRTDCGFPGFTQPMRLFLTGFEWATPTVRARTHLRNGTLIRPKKKEKRKVETL